jgi:hypothetical protein
VAGFEPTIAASERPQTHALEYAATGIGTEQLYADMYIKNTTFDFQSEFEYFVFEKACQNDAVYGSLTTS